MPRIHDVQRVEEMLDVAQHVQRAAELALEETQLADADAAAHVSGRSSTLHALFARARPAERLCKLGHAARDRPRLGVFRAGPIRQRGVEVALSDMSQDRRERQTGLVELRLRESDRVRGWSRTRVFAIISGSAEIGTAMSVDKKPMWSGT